MYNNYNKPISVTLVIILMSLSQMLSVQGQRPSFAGSRPANGGNQKDKYHTPQTQSADIANRFGGVEATPVQQLPFGAVQRPPMGVPIVVPQNTYLPLGGEVQPQVLVNNRIGGTDDNLLATNTPLAAAAPTQTLGGILRPSSTAATATTLSSFNPSTTTTQRLPLPLDAHGDYDLINQLSQVPEDHRPFWFLNYQAIEAHRNGTGSSGAFGATAQRGSFLG